MKNSETKTFKKKLNFLKRKYFNLSNTENTVTTQWLPLLMNFRVVSQPDISILYRYIISSLVKTVKSLDNNRYCQLTEVVGGPEVEHPTGVQEVLVRFQVQGMTLRFDVLTYYACMQSHGALFHCRWNNRNKQTLHIVCYWLKGN